MWCHGAIGIGLARMAMAKNTSIHSTRLELDVKRALHGTRLRTNKFNDSLCCGTMGNIELLKETSLFFSNSKLNEQAIIELRKTIQNAHQSGKYYLTGTHGVNPLGLFDGLAGVGYTLLRQVTTELPNILIFE